jgi:hypothetical protein
VPHSNCSVCRPPATSFSKRPIASLDTLAKILRVSRTELARVSQAADHLYRIGKRERKKDGTFRRCFDALGQLKTIQARIQCLILNKVDYPRYLQGGIKDRVSPRGQAANARLHVRKKTLITLDVKQFFPSVRRAIVFDIWQRFFRFPPLVAECLTKLTIKDGSLPQGAKTSCHLANLVFWEDEWRVVADFHEKGIHYTRLTDDVTCSSAAPLTASQITRCIAAIRTLCQHKGLQLNRQKQTIARAGTRMLTTKLVVNAKTSLPQERRSAIRAAVAVMMDAPTADRDSMAYQKRYRRVAGQVSYLRQHHPNQAAQLRSELSEVRPTEPARPNVPVKH